MPDVTREVRQLEEAIELISTGLLMIDQLQVTLIHLGGPKVVDITARLNAQYLALEKIIKPLKENIKAESFQNRDDTVRGDFYQAKVLKITKPKLDFEKIKSFFGNQLPQYQKTTREIEVMFDTKV